MNILFICKYNRFRSKIAEAYFNKVNKNSKLKAKSAGLVPGIPISKNLIKTFKKYNLKLKGKSKGINHKLLMWSDKIIIIDDRIPTALFNEEKINDGKKIIRWKISDTPEYNEKGKQKIIETIQKRINKIITQDLLTIISSK